MSSAESVGVVDPTTRRAAGALGWVQAGILTWAALALPWHFAQVFSIFAVVLAVVHALTALSVFLRPGLFARLWRAQAWLSLGFLLYLSWVVGSSVSYMVGVYDQLGVGLSAALLAAFAPAVLFTVPTSIWALAATGGVRSRVGGVLLSVVVLGYGLELQRWSGVGEGVSLVEPEDVARFQHALKAQSVETSSRAVEASLMTEDPATCPKDPGLRVVLSYRSRWTGRPETRCVVDQEPEALATRVMRVLRADAADLRVKADVWTGLQSLDRLPPLVPPFVIRPGLDGVCAGERCLMPWQLVALEQFNAFRPLDFIPDLRLGVDPTTLRARLAAPEASGRGPLFAGLRRLRTHSLSRDATGTWHRLDRLRPVVRPGPASARAVRDATTAAGAFVHRAQLADGRFMYRIHPFSGAVDNGRFSIARQAGTTLALCELGEMGSKTRAVAARSRALLARLLVSSPAQAAVGGLVWPRGAGIQEVRLGPSSLAAVALLTCRDRFGGRGEDAAIGALGEFLLESSTPSGRFVPAYNLEKGRPLDGHFRLYADGQAVYALVLLEQMAQAEPGVLPRSADVYGQAAEQAMRFYGGAYWQIPARDFFFIEENWHCLAARAALASRRVDEYERFCLDYTRFKARLVFDEGRGVRPDAVGGFHFSNVTPPMSTPTAGFAEAAAAALKVASVREEPLPKVEAALERALAFLVRAQWSGPSCFACSEKVDMRGAFSESLSSPIVRIDFVQHAWAALGHGGRVLGFAFPPTQPSG